MKKQRPMSNPLPASAICLAALVMGFALGVSAEPAAPVFRVALPAPACDWDTGAMRTFTNATERILGAIDDAFRAGGPPLVRSWDGSRPGTAVPGAENPGACAPGTEQAAPGHPSFANQSLRLDKECGTMVLDTPRTSGGFAESGRLDCGALSFEIAGDPAIPATIWASSLDGKPLAQSSRILLTHLTDVQGDGALYSDETRRILLKWGKKPLVEVGSAEVELRLAAHAEAKPETAAHAEPIHPAVWSLDTAGNRVSEIPAAYDPATGILRFTVSTRGTDGHGRIHYEIAR